MLETEEAGEARCTGADGGRLGFALLVGAAARPQAPAGPMPAGLGG